MLAACLVVPYRACRITSLHGRASLPVRHAVGRHCTCGVERAEKPRRARLHLSTARGRADEVKQWLSFRQTFRREERTLAAASYGLLGVGEAAALPKGQDRVDLVLEDGDRGAVDWCPL